jgi:hypothetical protein
MNHNIAQYNERIIGGNRLGWCFFDILFLFYYVMRMFKAYKEVLIVSLYLDYQMMIFRYIAGHRVRDVTR